MGAERWKTILGGVALVALVGAVFGRAMGFGLLEWDDRANFVENPHVATESLRGIGAFWSGAVGELYVPVTYTVWAVVARIGGLLGAGPSLEVGEPGAAPALFHGANVVFHAGSAVLVFFILRMVGRVSGVEGRGWGAGRETRGGGPGTGGEGSVMRGRGTRGRSFDFAQDDKQSDARACWGALIGAGVFALHPVQVEAVAWATGLKDVLAGFLGLAAMGVYLGRTAGGEGRGAGKGTAKYTKEAKIGEGDPRVEGRGAGATSAGRRAEREGQQKGTGGTGWGGGWRGKSDVAALGLFVLALLAKPGAAAVPVLLLVLETVVLGVSWKRCAARLWPWFAAAAAVVLVTRGVQGESVALAMPEATPLWFRPFVFLDALGFYAGKIVAPFGLAVDYGRSPRWLLESGEWRVTWVAGAALTIGAVLGSGFRVHGWGRERGTAKDAKDAKEEEEKEPRTDANGREAGKEKGETQIAMKEQGSYRERDSRALRKAEGRREEQVANIEDRTSKIGYRGVLAGAWFVFVAGMLPVSGLMAFAFQRNSTVADRYLYLPMLGVGMAVAVLVVLGSRFTVHGWGGGPREAEGEHRRSHIVPVAGCVLVILLGVLSSWQLEYWRDSRALVVRALAVNPGSAEMNYARGSQLFESGDVEMAAAFYRLALEGDARHWRAHHQLADALGEKGDWGGALAHLREANAIMPGHPLVLGDLGFALAATGKRREAEGMYRRVLEVAPGDVRARHDLGVLLLERGAFGDAVAELRRVWEEAPDETTAGNLRKALERYAREMEASGRGEEAAAMRGEATGLKY